jgi:hypothetical protein
MKPMSNGTMTDYNLPSILPFMFVWAQTKRTIGKGKKARTFHIIGYGAYNALGLIGTEANGIAICELDPKGHGGVVVTDEIARGHIGACGTSGQRAEFKRLVECNDGDFLNALFTGRSRIA